MLILISPSFSISGRLCIVIVAFLCIFYIYLQTANVKCRVVILNISRSFFLMYINVTLNILMDKTGRFRDKTEDISNEFWFSVFKNNVFMMRKYVLLWVIWQKKKQTKKTSIFVCTTKIINILFAER